MKKTLTINLLGGPGSGKSTLASGIFYNLKMLHIDCELVTEFAKYLTWEKNYKALEHQFYVSAKQMHREYVVQGQVDCVITDSPIITGLLYYKEENEVIRTAFVNYILSVFKSQNQINLFINRKKKYNPNGRNQTEAEAIEIDSKILSLMDDNGISYVRVDGSEEGLLNIINLVKDRLKN